MKVACFFEDTHYINPTESILIKIIEESFTTNYITYDYSNLDEEFSKNDIFIVHMYSLNYLKYGQFPPKISKNYKSIIADSKNLFNKLSQLDKPVLILMTRSDWYSEDDSYWNNLPNNFYLLGGFKKGFLDVKPNTEKFTQFYGQPKASANRLIDDTRIIPIHHIVSNKEIFISNKLKNRQKTIDISILGVLYTRRRNLYNKLLEYNFRLNKRFLLLLIALLTKYININRIYNYIFYAQIAKSKLSYTDGSEMNMFIRKYLEIPLFNSVLICTPFNNMKEFGFIKNEHYIELEENKIDENIRKLLNDDTLLNNISNKSKQLVISNFSENIYKTRIKKIFNLLYRNKYNDAKWLNGKFLINEKTF